MDILITGLPGSGTTALYYKIGNSLPGPKHAFFEPFNFTPEALEQEIRIRRGTGHLLAKVLISDNDRHLRVFKDFEKKVLLIRDPRDNLISNFLYSTIHSGLINNYHKLDKFLSLIEKKEGGPKGMSLLDLIETRDRLSGKDFLSETRLSREFSMAFHHDIAEALVLRYEDLVDNKFTDLERHLGCPLRASTEVDKQYRRVARTKSYGDWKNWFTDQDVQYFRPQLSAYMNRYDYSNDWTLPECPVINPQFGSGYLKRIVTEQLRKREQQRHSTTTSNAKTV